MEDNHFIRLIDKYLQGQATAAEKLLVEEYYKRLEERNVHQPEHLEESLAAEILQNVFQVIRASKKPNKKSFARLIPYSLAASLVCLCLVGFYFWTREDGISPQQTKVPISGDVAPGGNKAVLTLADGRKIALDDIKHGEIARQAGIIITKAKDGKLVYEMANSSSEGGAAINQVETPKGGQYQLNLPDGSKVWLNSASVLKFPARFSGGERKVQLVGEAYFEIAHNPEMPFKITTGNQVVEVLGTHFNIQAYPNEAYINTTLLEGSVNVSATNSDRKQRLKPGQASHISKQGELEVLKADVQQATSWKNGQFLFNDAQLTDILRQLERWYDVQVDYTNIPKTRYNVHLSRNLKLSDVLKTLELTGPVKFHIENKTIIINP